MSDKTIFLLGASGFIGGHTLKRLGEDLPSYRVIALVRDINANPEKKAKVAALHPNVELVDGDLNDATLIKSYASKYPITVNVASSDHPVSVKATLDGLEEHSGSGGGGPPIYIHISGMGVISDNARGERVENIKPLSDLDYHPTKVPRTNVHLDSDIPITEAGERTVNRVRTAIVYPGWVYGEGVGAQRTTFGVRIYRALFPAAGHAGTWGPGENQMTSVHVVDVASAITTLLKAMLEGRADEGKDGHCKSHFVLSEQPLYTMKDFTAAFGDALYKHGELKEGGSKPFPPSITDQMGDLGWCSLGGNQIGSADRLRKLGWEPVESRKISVFESMPLELEVAFQAAPVLETAPGERKQQTL
ncbi:NAD(P)-binding protein [Cylindrobasidium torrendii FP15055 ss-10]|uniref:NAD(P)-binding protein n=1 Tax=Cylindrobasidium torrendii FP15055 ss-10 TaxID=1314674 RepID=A0A0D7BBB0_9AGAR|nr:NAD(P)-binding protein [Cylindrobasidium torrendii FP15055 ss-10]